MHSLPPLRPAPAPELLTRRKGLARMSASLLLGLPLAWHGAARAQGRLPLTPGQTEGPFYPVQEPADADGDLLVHGNRRYRPAQTVLLTGQVMDPGGQAVRGASVEIWQCDAQGHYHHPGDGGQADPDFQGFGRVAVDASGHYRFRTLRPAPYSGRTPHIHVKVKLEGRTLLTTQLYVEGDPGNARDGLWRRLRSPEARAALTRPFLAQPGEPGSWTAQFPIVVEA